MTIARELENNLLSFAMKLIHEAKSTMNEEFVRSGIDFLELRRCNPHLIVGMFVLWNFTVSYHAITGYTWTFA